MKQVHPLSHLIDAEALLAYAGARAFERGEAYFKSGHVQEVVETSEGVKGSVLGTALYETSLHAKGRRLVRSCTCPVGADGDFCKHCVALGLAWLGEPRPGRSRSRGVVEREPTMEDLRASLRQRDKEDLVDVVTKRAAEDEPFRRRLLMDASRRRSRGADLAVYRKALQQAVGSRRFVPYSEMYGYTRDIGDVVDSMSDLLKDGHSHEVVELTEYALVVVERAMEHVDDSDGGVGDLLRRLEALHLSGCKAACKSAQLDPIALAERLFEFEMRSEFDVFHRAATAYRHVLGPDGLAAYTKLARAVWDRMPPLGPNDEGKRWVGDRFRITQIMEALAENTKDVDALVAIKERDLSSAYVYLQIAEILAKARRKADAVEWAERGIAAFPKATDARLRCFLADRYQEQGRVDDAMKLVWSNFADRPCFERYCDLKKSAERAKQWPEWRTRALDLLHDRAPARRGARPRSRFDLDGAADRSTLVQILLSENEVDEAWSEARAGGCREELWMDLARRREKEHPEDALFVIQSRIEPTLGQKDKYAYGQAVRLLRKARELLVRLRRASDFDAFLASVRAAHRPKRNFMKLLDRERWE